MGLGFVNWVLVGVLGVVCVFGCGLFGCCVGCLCLLEVVVVELVCYVYCFVDEE